MEDKNDHPWFTKLIDLAAERLGGKVLFATDDFFAEKENLIKPGRGIFIADKYTDRGKWMDGWESRRKRVPGHDWCVVKLATSGKISGVDIDTNFFLGNHPPEASIEAAYVGDSGDWESASWFPLLQRSKLQPGSQNFFEVANSMIYDHVKLHIYPDGGVARLKVYGEVFRDWEKIPDKETIDLAAAVNGARPLACNDMFFSHMENLIMPGRGINMGDGWETKRNRTPGNSDWVIVKLAHRGQIEKLLVDTCHFKGNYPDSCKLEGVDHAGDDSFVLAENVNWTEILPQSKLQADHEYKFDSISAAPFTHVKLTIFPDGGISRLRCWGRVIK